MPACTGVACQYHRIVLDPTTTTTSWINNNMNSFSDDNTTETTETYLREHGADRPSTNCSTESDVHDEWIIPLKREDKNCARDLTSELVLEGRRIVTCHSKRNSTQSLSSMVLGDLSTLCDDENEDILPLKGKESGVAVEPQDFQLIFSPKRSVVRKVTGRGSSHGNRDSPLPSTNRTRRSLSLGDDVEEEEILPLKGKESGTAVGPQDFQLIFSPKRSVVRKVMGRGSSHGKKDGPLTSTNHSRRSSSSPSLPNLSSIHEKSLPTCTDHSSRNLSSNLSSEGEWDDGEDSFAGHSPLSLESNTYRHTSASPILAAVSSLLLSHQQGAQEADLKEFLSPRICRASSNNLGGPKCRWGDSMSLPDGSGPPRLPMHRGWED